MILLLIVSNFYTTIDNWFLFSDKLYVSRLKIKKADPFGSAFNFRSRLFFTLNSLYSRYSRLGISADYFRSIIL